MAVAEVEKEKVAPQPKADQPPSFASFLTAPKPAKPDDKGAPDSSKESATEKKVEPASEAKAEAKDEPKASEDADKLKKQLKDTRDAFTVERQRNNNLEKSVKGLEEQLKILGQKLDGTYTDPGPRDPQEILTEAALGTRIVTSKAAAEELYGAEEVEKLVYAEDAPFRKLEAEDAEVRATVMNAKLPVVKAIQILKERAARQKYGGTVEEMRESLKKELQPEIEKQVRAELEARFKGRKVEDPIHGLSGARGVSREEALAPKANLKLDSIFKTFPSQPGA